MVVQQCIGWGTVPENGKGRRGDTEEGEWDYICSGEEEGGETQRRESGITYVVERRKEGRHRGGRVGLHM